MLYVSVYICVYVGIRAEGERWDEGGGGGVGGGGRGLYYDTVKPIELLLLNLFANKGGENRGVYNREFLNKNALFQLVAFISNIYVYIYI